MKKTILLLTLITTFNAMSVGNDGTDKYIQTCVTIGNDGTDITKVGNDGTDITKVGNDGTDDKTYCQIVPVK